MTRIGVLAFALAGPLAAAGAAASLIAAPQRTQPTLAIDAAGASLLPGAIQPRTGDERALSLHFDRFGAAKCGTGRPGLRPGDA
ncbi:MAG: hypothetical protein R2752_11360 [Vicinamibacterales bacterium]